MRKNCISRGNEIMMLVLLVCSSISCLVFGAEFNLEENGRIQQEDKKWSSWLNKYVKSVLYIGMPEGKFASLFTKDIFWSDSDRPHIIHHKNDKYIIMGLKSRKYRVTFKNGLLLKLEEYGWEKIPLLTANYRDVSDLLKGYEISEGLYKGMPEDEFLRNFSHEILSKFKNGYVVVTKKGEKYGVEFINGFLTHSWRTGK